MVNQRRNELEIINEILMLAHNNVKKTAILYKCNLSYVQMQKYLSFLTKIDAIKKTDNNGTSTYKITRHGHKFLKDIDTVLVYFGA